MEAVGLNKSFWNGRSAYLTGHTGFMGGWLGAYLSRMGADVHGFSLRPPTDPSFFEATDLASRIASSTIGDVRNLDSLAASMRDASPSIVFHLAAQPLVRRAYSEPLETMSTNVMGTANVLEAARQTDGVQAIVVVTTDKVYRNMGMGEPFTEDDELGGREPYSASKAASEFVVEAWRHSYLKAEGTGVATVRAGNIFGGGDWAADRLIPDAVRTFMAREPLVLRNPHSTRPWQHVLDPIIGYLTLAEQLVLDGDAYSRGWNFGPHNDDCRTVGDLAKLLATEWGDDAHFEIQSDKQIFEERFLSLNSADAEQHLGWKPHWRLETGIEHTIDWYRGFARGEDMWELTMAQIDAHGTRDERI